MRTQSNDADEGTIHQANRTLGQCPHCSVPIPTALQLIEYETDRGRSRFAECPECGEVVRPVDGC